MEDILEQVEARLAQLRDLADHDPRGARMFAAYLATRAERLPADLRSRVFRELAPFAQASEDELASARRYAALRSTLADLDQRRRAPKIASGGAVEGALLAARLASVIRFAVLSGFTVAALLVVAAIFAENPTSALLAAAGAIIGFVSNAGRWLVRMTEHEAVSRAERASGALGVEQMMREAETAHAALVSGEDGRWLRELVSQHPALAFEGVQPRSAAYRDGARPVVTAPEALPGGSIPFGIVKPMLTIVPLGTAILSGVALSVIITGEVAPESIVGCEELAGVPLGSSVSLRGCGLSDDGALVIQRDGDLLATVLGRDREALVLPLRPPGSASIVAWLGVPPDADLEELRLVPEICGDVTQPRLQSGLGLLRRRPYIDWRLCSGELTRRNRIAGPVLAIAFVGSIAFLVWRARRAKARTPHGETPWDA